MYFYVDVRFYTTFYVIIYRSNRYGPISFTRYRGKIGKGTFLWSVGFYLIYLLARPGL